MSEASKGKEEVTKNIASVNQAATETGDSAVDVLETAKGVAERATVLREQVAAFLSGIRAADGEKTAQNVTKEEASGAKAA